ncbi:MAG: DUF4139 domain-containing protein [Bacteroidia bacterium]|nr:DUF4139 domain-containing protein [Bacteroidia bacterium]
MLKQFFTLLLLLAFVQISFAAEDEKNIDSKIREVTVYLSGAQVMRTGSVQLPAGEHNLVFSGVALGINPQSIQASAPPELIIQATTLRTNYLKVKEIDPKIKVLNDSLELLQLMIDESNDEAAILNQEKTMILANQSLKGNDVSLSIDELKKAADFWRSRLTNIYDLLFKIKINQKDLNESIGRIRNQLNQLNYKRNTPTYEILVKVLAEKAGTFPVEITYFTPHARWTPRYDLRAVNTSSPVKLAYHADVFQNTGIDWNKVPLSLSTGNPNLSGTPPELSIWNLSLMAPISYNQNKKMGAVYQKGAVMQEQSVGYDNAPATRSADEESDDYYYGGDGMNAGVPAGLSGYTQVKTNTTTEVYRISLPQTIPADNQAHQITIRKTELPAFYEHFSVPKLDEDAFLLAGIMGWDTLNLLAGPANIYFEGTFLGQTSLNPAQTEDTLYFSLGRDKGVVVAREQLKSFTKVKTLGSSKECTFGYEITIRNGKKEAVTLELQDQIPISQDKDIVVKQLEISEGELDADRGFLTWRLELKPGETKKIKLAFSVKHPKNRRVNGL